MIAWIAGRSLVLKPTQKPAFSSKTTARQTAPNRFRILKACAVIYGRGDLFQRMLSRLILPIPESACMSRISVSGLFSLCSAASASTQIPGPARSSLAQGPRIRRIRLSGSPVRSAVPLPIGFPRASFRHNLRFSVGDRRHISGRTNRICQTKSLRRRRDGICGKQTAPARGSFQAPRFCSKTV